ncbi:hypothetical protein AVEN_135912-1 [Araneus ventricosus]|uniref:Integrase catalytic domain-containing protein n=1 Tax=Araneus ventricosus TaxID=182803 RepID=A0A4Y2N484_ARAVE|nr:hypothetical protein AVEN_135912-1 [Araneus ventricosus]
MPLVDIRAETVAQTLYSGWISRFGVPERISTDRGSQFTSDVFHSLTKPFGIRPSHAASYYPQANGAIERWHRTLKAAIMCHTSVHWVSAFPAVLLGLRTVFKEDLQYSPAEMVYGENLCLPSQFFVQQQPQAADNGFIKKLKTHIQQLRAAPTSNHSAKPTFVYRDLRPYKVLSRTNKNFIILKGNKKVTVTIDRLKPAHLLLDNVNSSESKLDSPRVDTSSSTSSAEEPDKSAMPLPEKSPILTLPVSLFLTQPLFICKFLNFHTPPFVLKKHQTILPRLLNQVSLGYPTACTELTNTSSHHLQPAPDWLLRLSQILTLIPTPLFLSSFSSLLPDQTVTTSPHFYRTLVHTAQSFSRLEVSVLRSGLHSKILVSSRKNAYLKGFGNLVVGKGKGLSQRFP